MVRERIYAKKNPNIRTPNDIVTLIVGEGDSTKEFSVHKEHVCHYSPVLNPAFNGSFVEGQSQTCRLHANESTAQFLLQWLYTQRLDILQLRTKKYDKEECDSLVRLWILGDYLLIPQLQNYVIDSLFVVMKQFQLTPIHGLRYIYEHTSTDSKLRLLFLHRCCFCMASSEFKAYSEEFPNEMLIEVATLTGASSEAKVIQVQQLQRKILSGDWSGYKVPEDQASDTDNP
jgi:hypothetical protein